MQKAQEQLFEECLSEMRKHLIKATETIIVVMEDDNVSPQIRLNAADMLQRNYLKFTERIDILERLDRLEHFI